MAWPCPLISGKRVLTFTHPEQKAALSEEWSENRGVSAALWAIL